MGRGVHEERERRWEVEYMRRGKELGRGEHEERERSKQRST